MSFLVGRVWRGFTSWPPGDRTRRSGLIQIRFLHPCLVVRGEQALFQPEYPKRAQKALLIAAWGGRNELFLRVLVILDGELILVMIIRDAEFRVASIVGGLGEGERVMFSRSCAFSSSRLLLRLNFAI